MSNETSKISELDSATRIKENALIPVVNTNTETNNIDLSTLRSALWFENAYTDIASGLAGTEKGESFFVYEDETKASVLGWMNQGGDSYSPLLDSSNQQISLPANNTIKGLINFVVAVPSSEVLRNIKPLFEGQRVKLLSDSNIFIYTTDILEELKIDDGGVVIKPLSSPGFWVRENVISGECNTFEVKWWTGNKQGFNVDISDEIQTACDTAVRWATISNLYSKVIVKLPPKWYITKSITINIRYIAIDGGRGYGQIAKSGEYAVYTSLSSNVNIINTPEAKVPIKAVFILKGTWISGGIDNNAYHDMELFKDVNLSLADNTSGQWTMVEGTDSGIAAFVHFGDANNKTISTAQCSFKNINTYGFGIRYINGDYSWGVNWYECKSVADYIGDFLIDGEDNSERINFFGCVWQNGYRAIYSSSWGGDGKIIGGSIVWMKGTYIQIDAGSNVWDISPSRIERVNTSAPLIVAKTKYDGTSGLMNANPIIHLHDSMILIDSPSLLAYNYLFSMGKYVTFKSSDVTWSIKNAANLINTRLMDKDDTKGRIIFDNNTSRVGPLSQLGRDNRFLTTKTAAGVLNASNITIGGSQSSTVSVSNYYNDLTLQVNSSTTTGTLTFLLKFPVDIAMSNWASMSWKAVFTSLSLNEATIDNWTVEAFVSSTGADYANGRISLGSVKLKDWINNFTDVHPNNTWGYSIVKRRDEWDRIPSEFYLYFSSGNARTSGDKIVINRAGLLMY